MFSYAQRTGRAGRRPIGPSLKSSVKPSPRAADRAASGDGLLLAPENGRLSAFLQGGLYLNIHGRLSTALIQVIE